MPEKDPSFWAALVMALREHGLAMMLTFILSYIRLHLYGEEKTSLARLIESLFGALLIMLVGLAVNSLGANLAWTLFAAGLIGLLGIDQVRALAQKWAMRKVEG